MRKKRRDYKHCTYISMPEAQDMNKHETYRKGKEGTTPLCVSYMVMVKER